MRTCPQKVDVLFLLPLGKHISCWGNDDGAGADISGGGDYRVAQVSQHVGHPVDHYVGHPVGHPVDHPVCHPVDHPVGHLVGHPVDYLVGHALVINRLVMPG